MNVRFTNLSLLSLCTHTHTHTHTHIYIHTYTHPHTHIYSLNVWNILNYYVLTWAWVEEPRWVFLSLSLLLLLLLLYLSHWTYRTFHVLTPLALHHFMMQILEIEDFSPCTAEIQIVHLRVDELSLHSREVFFTFSLLLSTIFIWGVYDLSWHCLNCWLEAS